MSRREFIITEETKAMAEKVDKIYKEIALGWGRKRLDTATLKEFGNWLYKYRNDLNDASGRIELMLYNNLDLYEHRIVLEAFDKNVDTDFSDIIAYLIKKLNDKLIKNVPLCVDIISDYFQIELENTLPLNFNRYLQAALADEIISIADKISCGKIKASDDIVMQCDDLIDFAMDGHLSTYIAYLIEKNGLFSETLAIIHGIYFEGKPFLSSKIVENIK